MKNRDYQVRIEYESDGTEEVYAFDNLADAELKFILRRRELLAEGVVDDVHLELLEVLKQERIEPPYVEEA